MSATVPPIPANTSIVGLVETAIHARVRLAEQAGVLGYHYRQVESLPIDIDDLLGERIQAYPACFTVFGGAKATKRIRGVDQVEATYHVVVAAENARNEASSRLGASAAEIGSYQLALDMVALLSRQTLGLAIDKLMLNDLKPLYTGKTLKDRKISLWAVEFTTTFDLGEAYDIDVRAVGIFDTFHSTWDLAASDPLSGLPPWKIGDDGEEPPALDLDLTDPDQQHVYRPDAVDHQTGLYTQVGEPLSPPAIYEEEQDPC